jgi:hypothetical protein
MQFSLKLGKAATEMHEMPVTTNGSDDVTNKTVLNCFRSSDMEGPVLSQFVPLY